MITISKAAISITTAIRNNTPDVRLVLIIVLF